MAIPRFAHPSTPDVRLDTQTAVRPTSRDGISTAVKLSPGFRPYVWREPRREGLVPVVPKGA